ncbi:MAG: hypothetical protein WA152_03775 [Microgenomates group bacterium]
MDFKIYTFLDLFLRPLMYLLQGNFSEIPQETHPWHVKRFTWKEKGVLIEGNDRESRFGQSGLPKRFGLFHMPILGGLKKYVILENKNYINYWNVGWNDQIQKLKIYDNRIKLLVGKEDFDAFGLSDNKTEVNLKIIDFGKIGDSKYKNVRLF